MKTLPSQIIQWIESIRSVNISCSFCDSAIFYLPEFSRVTMRLTRRESFEI